MAEQKVVVMLQEEDVRQPIDYRDVVRPYTKASQIPALLADVIPLVWERVQSVGRKVQTLSTSLLARVDLGDVAAENEFGGLDSYFVRTGAFHHARQGHSRLVVGRKGSGKTAIFYEIRNPLLDTRSALVLDLMPEGHQFTRLKELVLQGMKQGLREYTLAAFWHYVLLTELARKILINEALYADRDPGRAQRYQKVDDLYREHDPDFGSEFPQRLLREVERLIERVRESTEDELSKQLMQILFTVDIPALEEAVAEYLTEKQVVWLLIDNLDKGWPIHGTSTIEITIVKALLEATRKVQNNLEAKGVGFRSLVFLRSDIYEHLLREIPDKGKETAISLDWDDPALFEEIIRRRIETSTGLEGDFAQTWRQVSESHLEAQDTFNYIIERTLMRPRDLLQFVRKSIEVALNRNHSLVQVEDILHAEKIYSEDILLTTLFEINDTYPGLGDVLLAFHGASRAMSRDAVQERLEAGGLTEDKWEKTIEILFKFSFLGVVYQDTNVEEYAYAVQANIRKLTYPTEIGTANFVIHPAFREGLEIGR